MGPGYQCVADMGPGYQCVADMGPGYQCVADMGPGYQLGLPRFRFFLVRFNLVPRAFAATQTKALG